MICISESDRISDMGHKPRVKPQARAQSTPSDVPPALMSALEGFRKIDVPWSGADGISGSGAVWKMTEPNVEVASSLYIPGTLLVKTGKHDWGFLLVHGDVHCRNLVVASGFTFVCTGSLLVEESIIATAGDSVTYVGGEVHARFLDSGSGAWLTAFRDNAIKVAEVCGYTMFGSTVTKGKADIVSLLVADAVESEEWDSLSPEEQEEEGPYRADYLRVDDGAARRILASGKSILR
jgi:hypothetical protein